jgi:hypothetical protein
MTMDVYAQLQQRAERQHGEAFDALLRRARERLCGTDADVQIAQSTNVQSREARQGRTTSEPGSWVERKLSSGRVVLVSLARQNDAAFLLPIAATAQGRLAEPLPPRSGATACR